MRIAIHTLGTRGDVLPYLALALELKRRGHDVQLAAPRQFARLVAEHEISLAELPGAFLDLLATPSGREAAMGKVGASLRMLRAAAPLYRALLDSEWAAASAFAPDVLVHHPKCLGAPHIAERLAIPSVLAALLPAFAPTRAFPTPLLPFRSLGPLNRASHVAAIQAAHLAFRRLIGAWRKATLGLHAPGPTRRPAATLYGYSRHVVPMPDDWAGNAVVTGYWFLDDAADWVMPRALAAFLRKGPAPVYVGFGSMPGSDHERLADMVADGLAACGKRGIVASGGGALRFAATPPDHVHVIEAAPHEALFHHVSAALHHGGAGTTAASLRAGLPTVICPFMGDQAFWGHRVADCGAGPAPLRRKELSPCVIASAFRATDDPAMRRRAADLGRAIARENGVALAADIIERTGTDTALS